MAVSFVSVFVFVFVYVFVSVFVSVEESTQEQEVGEMEKWVKRINLPPTNYFFSSFPRSRSSTICRIKS